jgi:hypothetical protein
MITGLGFRFRVKDLGFRVFDLYLGFTIRGLGLIGLGGLGLGV